MIKLLIPLVVLFSTSVQAEMITINVNRVCAASVGIPYASDNFSDEEWVKFKNCVNFIQKFKNIK
jgi:hypothetical protein